MYVPCRTLFLLFYGRKDDYTYDKSHIETFFISRTELINEIFLEDTFIKTFYRLKQGLGADLELLFPMK
ncbi:hypothetical protein HMPREF9071_1536 [Capnocytophaga sp. oral taxon 338 str. F0234]|nr:hypothetical protein HMPREF9071_1536 [Capnocytophaga sp. oral taxon 338 str. F0234]